MYKRCQGVKTIPLACTNDFNKFITLVKKQRDCALYKYDFTFVNGIPYETQLTTVKCLYFNALVSNFNNSYLNFIKEGLKMVQQYRNLSPYF